MRKSIYKNVYPDILPSGTRVWKASIKAGNEVRLLGTFPQTEEGEKQAAIAVDKARKYKHANQLVSKLIYAIKQGYIYPENINALTAFMIDVKSVEVIEKKRSKEDIAAIVNRHFKTDVLVKSRRREVVAHRQMAQYLMVRHKHTLNSIGRFFGGQDHTTVLYSFNTVSGLMLVDLDYRREITYLESLLNEPNKIS